MSLNQEIFNTVVTHLRTQGSPAKDGYSCKYRSADGKMCAVGCLIEDDYYSTNLEGEGADAPDVLEAVSNSLLVDPEDLYDIDGDFLLELQAIHDDYTPDAWEKQFIQVAKSHNLTVPSN